MRFILLYLLNFKTFLPLSDYSLQEVLFSIIQICKFMYSITKLQLLKCDFFGNLLYDSQDCSITGHLKMSSSLSGLCDGIFLNYYNFMGKAIYESR